MRPLSANRVYHSQVLLLLGLPVYGMNTWLHEQHPPPTDSSSSFISRAEALNCPLNLWSGGSAEQLLLGVLSREVITSSKVEVQTCKLTAGAALKYMFLISST